MAYPGDGYSMSNYGRKKYSPEQVKEQWKEHVVREIKVRQCFFLPLPNFPASLPSQLCLLLLRKLSNSWFSEHAQ